ncbi:MAG: hypothetical protein ACE5QF_00460 [Thermoplasmata archaeon]
MRRLFSLLLFLLLSFGGTGNAMAQAHAPTISVGNTWKYSVSISLGDLVSEMEEGMQDVDLEGTVNLTVVSRQTVEVLNHSYDAWVIELEGDFDVEFAYTIPDTGTFLITAPAVSEGTLYLDNDSFEYVMTSLTITSNFRRFSVTFSLLLEAETYLAILSDTWDFPFDVGSAGSASGEGLSHARYSVGMSGTLVEENETTVRYAYNQTYECTDHLNVTVEAGEFEAYEVNASSPGIYLFGFPGGQRKEYYSENVNNNVRVEVYDNRTALVGEWNLLSYVESPTRGSGLEFLLITLIIIMLIVVAVIILLKRRSREATDRVRAVEVKRVCRRCGSDIPEGQMTCPLCGRAIW